MRVGRVYVEEMSATVKGGCGVGKECHYEEVRRV